MSREKTIYYGFTKLFLISLQVMPRLTEKELKINSQIDSKTQDSGAGNNVKSYYQMHQRWTVVLILSKHKYLTSHAMTPLTDQG